MGRGLVALGAALIVGGGAALGFALTRRGAAAPEMSAEQTGAMASAIARLDAGVKEAHSIARTRAATISQSRYVIAAVKAGDVATTRDMVESQKGGELKYELKPGEVIEIGKLTPTGHELLASQPLDAPPSGHGGEPGGATALDGTRAIVSEVAEVKADGAPIGYVTVVQVQDLAPELDRLAAAGIVGRFALGAQQVAIGGGLPAGAKTKEMALSSEPAAKLIVAVPPARPRAMSMPIAGAGVGGVALGVLAIAIAMLRRRPTTAAAAAAGPEPSAPPATGLDVAHARTVASLPPDARGSASGVGVGAAASTTPAPVDAQGATALLAGAASVAAGAMIGGRWEVIRRLGSGGMADVYLARSKGEAGFEKQVALKVMHAHLARNERAVEHFLDEARVAARIDHPNVVQIQDLGKIGDDYVIVMEYVDGVDLERLLASARAASRLVPVEVGLGILRRICDGLHAAHTATAPDGTPLGIIHRDVKSANVLVSRQGIVKVVDFGIAKAATQAHLTNAGETKGTPSMMSPEQRVGEVVDVRADVYSVAAVGFEILTGHAVNLDLAVLAHLGIDNWPHLPAPSSLRPQLPPELDGVLLGAMAYERDRRPASCHDLEARCEEIMKAHGLTASDKDIGRWVDAELRALVPAFEGGTTTAAGKPAGAAS